MKKIIFSIFLSFLGITLFGQHQIEVTKLFEKNAKTSEVLLQFNLDQSLSETELVSITQWINDNNQIVKFAHDGIVVELTVKLTSFEGTVYQKAFMMMNISDIKLSDGKSISTEEFLSLNNL
jgi:hypothetical protein